MAVLYLRLLELGMPECKITNQQDLLCGASLNLPDVKTVVLAFFCLGLQWILELKPSFCNIKAIAS